LLNQALPRDHNNVISLPHCRVQPIERRHQAPLATIADHGDADTLAGDNAISIMQAFVRAYADCHCRMSMQPAAAPNSSEIGGPTQP